jgi:MoaA/NifB/PqqE/SkfB family radical SAM enzyme
MRLQPKLRPYINHIFQIVKNGGYSLLPDLLVLEISNRCNLRCKMCWWDFDRQEGDDQLNLTEIKMLIDQIKRFKPNLTINGEESSHHHRSRAFYPQRYRRDFTLYVRSRYQH